MRRYHSNLLCASDTCSLHNRVHAKSTVRACVYLASELPECHLLEDLPQVLLYVPNTRDVAARACGDRSRRACDVAARARYAAARARDVAARACGDERPAAMHATGILRERPRSRVGSIAAGMAGWMLARGGPVTWQAESLQALLADG